MSLDTAAIQRLSTLLDQARALPEPQRDAWLQALAGDDAALAGPLRAMLAQEARLADPGWFDRPPAPAALPWIGQAGERVGPYRLVEPLGRGGMGEVWCATRADGTFEREVALKIPRQRLGQDLASRLQFECKVAARLEHRHIARLYDAGQDEQGRPWIASELLRGQPLDRHAAATAGCGRNERLRLLAWVARAVAYAHRRGVLHRDLKPANVLVDEEGVPHLLDFGVAVLLEQPDAEPNPQRGLTPRYAAPEQRAGAADDVRADVYSIGVMAAELFLEADADLAAVIARATAADPEQRYASADELAAEFECCLRHEPVQARPLGWLQRRGRWLRRHRMAGGALGSVLVALAMGGGASLVQSQRAAQALQRERLAQEFVTDLLRIGHRQPGRDAALLDRGPDLVAARFPGQPEVQLRLLSHLDRAYRDMGDGAETLRLRQRRAALIEQLGITGDEQREGLFSLAEAQLRRGLLDEAEATLAVLTPLSAPMAPDLELLQTRLAFLRGQVDVVQGRMQALDARLPATGALRAGWMAQRAEMDQREGRTPSAAQRAEQAATLAAEAGDALAAADLRSRAAYWAAEAGVAAQARPLHEATQKTLRSQGGLQLVFAALEQAEFWSAMLRGRLASQDEVLAQVRDAYRQIEWLGDAASPRIAATVQRIYGEQLVGLGQLDEGARHLEAALDVLIVGEQRPLHRAYRHSELSNLRQLQGRLEDAEASMLDALADRQRAGFGRHPYVVSIYMDLALTALALGDAQRALRHLDSAPSDAEIEAAGHQSAWYRAILDRSRARVLLQAGDAAQALQLLDPLAPQDTDFQPDALAIGRPWLRAWALCALGREREGAAQWASAWRQLGKADIRAPAARREVQVLRERSADCTRRAGGRSPDGPAGA